MHQSLSRALSISLQGRVQTRGRQVRLPGAKLKEALIRNVVQVQGQSLSWSASLMLSALSLACLALLQAGVRASYQNV